MRRGGGRRAARGFLLHLVRRRGQLLLVQVVLELLVGRYGPVPPASLVAGVPVLLRHFAFIALRAGAGPVSNKARLLRAYKEMQPRTPTRGLPLSACLSLVSPHETNY